MSIWRTEVTPELLAGLSRGTFADRIGIRITEVGPDYLRATMPVTTEVHQPYGVLHGGASVALAETVGSVAANLCIDDNGWSASARRSTPIICARYLPASSSPRRVPITSAAAAMSGVSRSATSTAD